MERANPRGSKYVAALALAASVILVVGWLARPRAVPQNPVPTPSETELEQLARRAERRSLESMTKYFAGVSADVGTSLAYVRDAGVTGIVWDERRIVSAPLSKSHPPATVAVTASSVEASIAPDLWGPNMPLTVLTTPETLGALTAARRASSLPQPGDWVVAVWRTDGPQAFAAANFRQTAATRCGRWPATEVVSSVPLTQAMAGGGLFDIDGNLLGVILPCRDHIAAVETASIDAILERVDTVGQRLLARYGVALDSLDSLSNEEQRYFDAPGGLLVREVWIGSRAERAGVRPGDIVTGVGGRAVTAVDDLRPLTTFSEAPFDLAAQRGAKTLAFALRFDPQPDESGGEPIGAGVILESAPKAYRIDSVTPGSRAARAGIEPGDRLVRIDRSEPRSAQQVERILSARRPAPMLLEVEREDRRIAIVMP